MIHYYFWLNFESLIMDWIYTRQSLLNLRNLRCIAVLDYKIKQRITCLTVNKKFRSKRGNGRSNYGAKSLCRPWDKNSGIHWEVLKPIPASLQFILPRYLSALLNVRSLSSNLLQIQHLLESSSLDILTLTDTWTKQNQSLELIQGTLSTMGYSLVSSHRPGRTGGGLVFNLQGHHGGQEEGSWKKTNFQTFNHGINK